MHEDRSIQELYRDANRDIVREGTSIETFSDEVGASSDRIYSLQKTGKDTLQVVCNIIVRQAIAGFPYVLQRLAQRAGFLLVRVPQARKHSAKTVFGMCSKALKGASDAVEEFAAAVEDGTVTEEELARSDKSFDAAISAIQEARQYTHQLFERQLEAPQRKEVCQETD